MNAFDKIKKWMFGDETTARKRAERHQPKVSIGLATAESGDRQDDIDGLDVGGVIWPVEQGTHGGVSFISSQCFYATYDKKAKKVWLLDNETGTRHPGALPLIPGDTVFPEPDTGGRGLVIRTAMFGNDGLKRNVFIPLNAKLEAHHEQPDPPINSSQVFDEDGRHGGLHYLTKVMKMATKFCLGATDKLTEVFAPMLNFTRNGDGTPAHGIATFRASEACLSQEANGPLGPADDGQHILADKSDGRKIHSAHINRANALYGDSASGIIDSPKEFINQQWESGSKDAFVGRVEEREDFKDFHTNACGKRAKGKKKWQEWKPKIAPPTHPRLPRDPTEPPPPIDTPPRDPGEPGRPVIDPGPIPGRGLPVLPPVDSQPTNTGPNEEEQPSTRGIARADFDPPTGTGFEEARSHGVGTEDEVWKRATGMTQREFFDLRRVSHDVAQGVAAMALPAGISNSPVLMKAYRHSTFAQDSQGQWYGRRGFAPGVQTLMPGGLEGHMSYKARHGAKLDQDHALTRLLLNYKSGSYEVKTLLGLGARIETSELPASGWYFKLDYTDGHDVPDLDIRSTDSAGLDASTGRVVKINGTDITTTVTNAVTAASAFTAANRVLVADGADRSADDSDFAMTQNGTNVLSTASGAGIGFNAENLSDIGTIASGAHTIDIASTNAIARSVGEDSTTGPWRDEYPVEFRVSSSSATFDIATATDTGYIVELDLIFLCNTAGAPYTGGITQKAVFENAGGTVNDNGDLEGPTTLDPHAFGVTAVLSASGTNIRLTVTDSSGETIRVRGMVFVTKCGNGA